MANLRTTVTSLLGSIQTTADSASKLIDSSSRGIDMLDSYIQQAQWKQKRSHIAERDQFEQDLIREYTERNADAERKIQTKLDSDQVYAAMYKSNMDRLTEKLNALNSEK
ncbi:hypothetical protein HYP99_gp002 [Sinorhizobium phage ort11]|uniref:Uncharacterized protein n=1 Tax=Sinorhizobium phage ort11 TaxID=2599764 RepID=A0A5C2H1Y0_9CAUD|nr:hypothetical protein HYP99_gp002 [Sinorhizobium phage ort11]QEP29800.1 hypothetical protein Smphiort11_002 [Sinorhizobium phage ort11]